MVGYVKLAEHLSMLVHLYHVLTILTTTSVALIIVQFWRKW